MENEIIKQSETTTLLEKSISYPSYGRSGLLGLMMLFSTNSLFCETALLKDNELSSIFRNDSSITNLEIIDSLPCLSNEIFNVSFDEEYLDFSVGIIYTNEYKIKVKSIKVEKFIPPSF